MNEWIFLLLAFTLGYICGLLTKHELWVWVKRNGKKTKK